MPIQERISQPGPKRLLALDGGGIRGMITVELLAEIERLLQEELGRDERFVLADYFDYVAGTSTGAIIATCVALGMRVSEIRTFYLESGRDMFEKASLFKRLRYRYEDEPLAQKLRNVLGEDPQTGGPVTLGSEQLRSLLLVVLRNATTDSPWPLSNNPRAKYNDRARSDCNLGLPLWKIVRASTAAPVYFPPEIVQVGPKEFIFVDGGVTPYNNPAFLLFLMATVRAYRLEWPTGEDRLLLVSVGTGTSSIADVELQASQMGLLYNANNIPSALMFAASNEQDMLCRTFGRCRAGDVLDRELGPLMEGSAISHGEDPLPKLFTYMRYNVELSRQGLDELGLPRIRPADVQMLDSVDHIAALQEVGQAVARQKVKPAHFEGFFA